MKRLTLLLLLLSAVFLPTMAQQKSGAPTTVIPYPFSAPTEFFDYDGSSNLIYICYAAPSGLASDIANYSYSSSVTGGTLTSIVVSGNTATATTATAHGLMARQVTAVSGSTTSALNAVYTILTVPSTTTFTFTTAAVGDGTYNNGALTLSGVAPLLTSPIWSIEAFTYVSGNLVGINWANGAPGNYSNICANRAVKAPSAGYIPYK
jgi:hypothetical protein